MSVKSNLKNINLFNYNLIYFMIILSFVSKSESKSSSEVKHMCKKSK